MALLTRPTYTAAGIGRLAGMSPDRVRRWLRGYGRSWGREVRPQPSAVRPEGPMRARYASFLELVDLLFVKAFLDHGVGLRHLRRALGEAADLLGTQHFARQTFFTEGRRVYLEIRGRESRALLELQTDGQWVIAPVIVDLAKRIHFDPASEVARRWYPRGQSGYVVVDPAIGFGQPTLTGRGIRTSQIHDLYQAEGEDVAVVCRWWGLSRKEVEAAVDFEQRLAA